LRKNRNTASETSQSCGKKKNLKENHNQAESILSLVTVDHQEKNKESLGQYLGSGTPAEKKKKKKTTTSS